MITSVGVRGEFKGVLGGEEEETKGGEGVCEVEMGSLGGERAHGSVRVLVQSESMVMKTSTCGCRGVWVHDETRVCTRLRVSVRGKTRRERGYVLVVRGPVNT